MITEVNGVFADICSYIYSIIFTLECVHDSMLSLIGLPSGDFCFVVNLAYKYDIIVRLLVTFARCIMQSFDLRSKGLGEQRMLAKTLEEWE